MALRTVGPGGNFPTIAAAMLISGPGDTIQLLGGYSNETATITNNGMVVTGDVGSTGIVLQLGAGIATFTTAGTAPFTILDAGDGNGIVGNSGDNTVTVTAGIDAVDGGLGVDRLVVDYSLATGAVTGNSASDFTEAGGGARSVTITAGTFENFTILTGPGADTITVGDGTNIINVGSGANTVTTGNGNNLVTGGINADTITTGGGNDTIDGGDGTNVISAGQGFNVITGGNGADTVTALDGGNSINVGDGANRVTTGAGADTILTGVDADIVISGAGDDLITIRGGNDSADAGAGSDRLTVDYSAMITNVTGGVTSGNLSAGYVGNIADSAVSFVDFQGVESFSITTGSGADNIVAGDGADILIGGAGNDTLAGAGGDDLIEGGSGSDVLDGGAGIDTATFAPAASGVFYGLLAQGSAFDTVGAGTDTLTNFENLIGSAFNDTLGGDTAANVLDGGDGDDISYGWFGNDTLLGGAGSDTLDGGGGSDSMVGGAGDDTYVVDAVGDLAVENPGGGTDSVFVNVNGWTSGANLEFFYLYGSAASVTGSLSAETLVASATLGSTINAGGGNDTLWGQGGADILSGEAGADVIRAGAGNDTVNGGLGNDQLVGGTDADVFQFDAPAWGYDQIFDFSRAEGDRIDMRGSGITSLDAFAAIQTFGNDTQLVAADGSIIDVYGFAGFLAGDFIFS